MADFEISETYVSDDPENLTDFLGIEIAGAKQKIHEYSGACSEASISE